MARPARPALHAWSAAGPLRLAELRVARDDPDPKAVACYGLVLRPDAAPPATGDEEWWLRFVEGRPVSALTIQFLVWCCDVRRAGRPERHHAGPGRGQRQLARPRCGAALRGGAAGRRWLRAHNQRVQRAGGVRIVPCFLPTKSPWLNPIEPKWVHGKRRILDPARLLTAAEGEERVCAAFGCPVCAHLTIPQEVA